MSLDITNSLDMDNSLNMNNSLDMNNTLSNRLSNRLLYTSLYEECPICLEDLVKCIAKTNCGHKFHFECLSNWITSQRKIVFTCPSCNQNPCEIINVYSKKKSNSSLNSFTRGNSSRIQELNELENGNNQNNENNENEEHKQNNKIEVCCLCVIL